ncbi:glutamic acid-rich protein-like [Galleria mellonella]|uniref:Glutamic acid-rich protein-like n=1 Tax=Galleria mellonella TaxID=7137 RepID=A0A6J1WZP5_GALME|nr:glutamic acid-rich protein-like [Galleria mellonella]
MQRTRIPSPSRSHGSITPRRTSRRTHSRSVTSPTPSNASDKLTSIIQFGEKNRNSFVLSPMNYRRSLLTDNTDIDEPRRRSWWKKLNENTTDVIDLINIKEAQLNNVVEEYIDVEVLSQEKKNYTLDLPESSDNESISSIVIPQRKLFTQKENQPNKGFGQLIETGETQAKLHKTNTNLEKSINVAPKTLFGQGSKPRSKIAFPAALLKISPNKTANKTKEIIPAEVKGQVRNLFGNKAGTKRKNIFADFIVSDSEDEISDIQPRVFGFQKRSDQIPHRRSSSTSHGLRDISPTSSITTDIEMYDWNLLPSSTMVENQLEDNMIANGKTPVKRAKLSKLSVAKESETRSVNADYNKNIPNSNIEKTNELHFEAHHEELQNMSHNGQKSGQVNEIVTSKNTSKKDESSTTYRKKDVDNTKIIATNNETVQDKYNGGVENNIGNSKCDKVSNVNVSTKDEVHKIVDTEDDKEIKNNSHIVKQQEPRTETEEVKEMENETNNYNSKEIQEENQEDEVDNENEVEEENKEIQESDEEDHDNQNLQYESEDEHTGSQNQDISSTKEESHEDEEMDDENEVDNYHNKEVEEENQEDEEVDNENEVEDENKEIQESDEEDHDNQNLQYKSEDKHTGSRNQDISSTKEESHEDEEMDDENEDDNYHSKEVEEENQEDEEEMENENETEDKSEEIQENEEEKHDDQILQYESEEDQNESQEQNIPSDEEEEEIDKSEQINETEQKTSEDCNITKTNNTRPGTREKSPEAILSNKTNHIESFTAQGRNTSIRMTKSMTKPLNVKPSMALLRESTGVSDGTKNSSAEGSGWDSHRTTRKTLRQTFGRDFTPRKSLRALVMEKSAKRHTVYNDENMATNEPIGDTELPELSTHEYNDDEAELESTHETLKQMRQTTLEIYLQKIKKQNMEKKKKMEEEVRNSLKAPSTRDVLNPFKVPARPNFTLQRATTKTVRNKNKSKSKQVKSSVLDLGDLPTELLEDMKYKPPPRFQPRNASWITKRLYKFLETKLEPKYDYKTRLRSEKLVETIYNFTKDVRRHPVAPIDAVEVLKHEMARLNVVKTHFEFYQFFHDFMPRDIRVKVNPDVVNGIPLPRHGVFADIL